MYKKIDKRKNGTGSAVFLGQGRYEPYAARITVGKKLDGKPVTVDIGYFKTELDALVCLENYHKSPTPIKIKKSKYDQIAFFSKSNYPLVPVESITASIHRQDKRNYTFKQVFEEMKKLIFPTKEEIEREKKYHIKAEGKMGYSTYYQTMTAYKKSAELYDLIYRELRASDFKKCINKPEIKQTLKPVILQLFKKMDSYAYSEDIIDKKYTEDLKSETVHYRTRLLFTYDDIEELWEINEDNPRLQFVRDFLLIAIYTGCRAEEILFTYTANVFFNDDYFVTGLKTQAGKNRSIPMHPLIKPIFEKYYKRKNEFLFNAAPGKRLTYGCYKEWYKKFIQQHPHFIDKTAHCGRHTLETELQKLNIKSTIINSILGHKNGNVADDVYNHVSIEEKIEAIKAVKYEEGTIHIFRDEVHSTNNRKTL